MSTGYELADGYVLTEDEIERRATEWENGSWEGTLIKVHAGRPRLSNEPNANLSFKCPVSDAELIKTASHLSGMAKSSFIREAALEKAARVLAEMQVS